jgi:hypothetical protein
MPRVSVFQKPPIQNLSDIVPHENDRLFRQLKSHASQRLGETGSDLNLLKYIDRKKLSICLNLHHNELIDSARLMYGSPRWAELCIRKLKRLHGNLQSHMGVIQRLCPRPRSLAI